MTDAKKYRYSEIFTSIQGEGEFTGAPTIWLRWFLCNLQCPGFGQAQPENPETHILPYKEFDVSSIKRIEDLPVWDKGCDSSYSWAKKYKHLCHNDTAAEIVDKLEDELRKAKDNEEGKFTVIHEGRRITEARDFHMCFTGGEPMMKKTQAAMMDVLLELERRKNIPRYITIETNGTQPLNDNLMQMIASFRLSGGDWFWSVSPKLLYTSGEEPSRAIKPEVVKHYQDVGPRGQLKFVVSNREEAWDELEEAVTKFRDAGVRWPVWIMPVGATVEEQSDDNTRAIVEETIRRGYSVAARVHCYIWGNQIGT
jgi:7-carboxy-7-deazaguanine synthase